jgi:hypothetical protein
MAGGQKANGKDRHARARRPRYTLIAVSFRQLFLGRVAPQQSPPLLHWLSNYIFCATEFHIF